MKWQPIETAPRDGTKILVYGCNSTYNWIGILEWDADSDVWRDDNSYRIDEEYNTLTHWMPLPDAPSEDNPSDNQTPDSA